MEGICILIPTIKFKKKIQNQTHSMQCNSIQFNAIQFNSIQITILHTYGNPLIRNEAKENNRISYRIFFYKAQFRLYTVFQEMLNTRNSCLSVLPTLLISLKALEIAQSKVFAK